MQRTSEPATRESDLQAALSRLLDAAAGAGAEEAREHARDIIALGQDALEAHGDLAFAERCLEEALGLDPDCEEALALAQAIDAARNRPPPGRASSRRLFRACSTRPPARAPRRRANTHGTSSPSDRMRWRRTAISPSRSAAWRRRSGSTRIARRPWRWRRPSTPPATGRRRGQGPTLPSERPNRRPMLPSVRPLGRTPPLERASR